MFCFSALVTYKDVHFTAKQCGKFTAIFCRHTVTADQWIFIDVLLPFICSPLARNAKLNWMNDLLKACKQPVFHLLRCQYSLDCSLFENCHSRKGVQQILQINWMHLKPNDSEIMCDPLCRVITVSMILAQHLFTLVTWLNSTRSWEDSHFGSESWWCTVLTATTWMCHLAAYCSFNVIIHVSALFGQMWIGHFVLPNQN